MEAYGAYLGDDCWGYRTFMYGQEMDSYWGFIEDIDDVKPDIAFRLADGRNQLVGKLEPRYQSAKEYLYNKTVAWRRWTVILNSPPSHSLGMQFRKRDRNL